MADLEMEINAVEGLADRIVADDDIEIEGELFKKHDDYIYDADRKQDEMDQESSSESDSLLSSKFLGEKSDTIYDLKIVYNKLLIITIVVSILCIMSLIAALIQDFYTWTGITFNCIIIFASIFGVFLGINMDELFDIKFKAFKLKLLLFYFILCNWFCIIIFVIELVYLVLIPIKIASDVKPLNLTLIMLSYFCSIVLWLIFVLFYIDIIARGCLKRGRIEWIVNYIKTEQSSFCYIFEKVLVFRKRFRSFRIFLTKVTKIKFIQYNVEHQKSLENIFVEPGTYQQKSKLDQLHDKYDELLSDVQRTHRKCRNCCDKFCQSIAMILIALALCYMLLPLVLLGIILALFLLPSYYMMYKSIACLDLKCIKVLFKYVAGVSAICACLLWSFLWNEVICPIDNEYGQWASWDTQCGIWYNVCLNCNVFVVLIFESNYDYY